MCTHNKSKYLLSWLADAKPGGKKCCENLYKGSHPLATASWRMARSVVLVEVIMCLVGCTLNPLLGTDVPATPLTQQGGREGDRDATVVTASGSSVKCELQGSARKPAFSTDGDYVIGGVVTLHHYKENVKLEYSTRPEPSKCTGRSVNKVECVARSWYLNPVIALNLVLISFKTINLLSLCSWCHLGTFAFIF